MEVDTAFLFGTGLGKLHLAKRRGLVSYYHEVHASLSPNNKAGLYAWDEYGCVLDDLKLWKPRKVFCFGHSYGASTLNFVCEALLLFPTVRITHAVYCDPVWRPEKYRISKLSLDSTRTLDIAANVEKLSTLEQDRQPISGHDCRVRPSTEYVRREVVTDRRHAFLDRHPLFKEMIFEAVSGS